MPTIVLGLLPIEPTSRVPLRQLSQTRRGTQALTPNILCMVMSLPLPLYCERRRGSPCCGIAHRGWSSLIECVVVVVVAGLALTALRGIQTKGAFGSVSFISLQWRNRPKNAGDPRT